ncbi:MAG: Uma2 family endonuclease [Chloroflexi bacterium]|nr:Uma2 family endonuclease [Chloroflexota bacterium]
MTTSLIAQIEVSDIPTEPIWRLSIDDYHAMIDSGILNSGDPIEFLEGWLVRKMTKNPQHSTATRLVRRAIERITPSGWFVDSQEPLTTSDSEPEPDVAIVRGDERDFASSHPRPIDISLLIEVSDSSLAQDRGQKKRIYAKAGIPVYWIVNLVDRTVEVFSQPFHQDDSAHYEVADTYRPAESIPVALDGAMAGEIAVDDLMP